MPNEKGEGMKNLFFIDLLVAVLVVFSVCVAGCGSTVSPPGQKDNLSVAQKKMSSDLLQLTDDHFLSPGMTRQALELQMETDHQLIYVDEKDQRTRDNSTGRPLVYVYISMKENTSLDIIHPFVWNVTDEDPANRIAVAWVDVRKIIELASLEDVVSLQTVIPPVSRGGI